MKCVPLPAGVFQADLQNILVLPGMIVPSRASYIRRRGDLSNIKK